MATASSSSSASGSRDQSSYQKVLQTNTINPHVLNVEYAVRGALSNKVSARELLDKQCRI